MMMMILSLILIQMTYPNHHHSFIYIFVYFAILSKYNGLNISNFILLLQNADQDFDKKSKVGPLQDERVLLGSSENPSEEMLENSA